MDLLFFMLPTIIVFGLVTFIEDYKKGIIRNLFVLLAILYSLLVMVSSVYYYSFSGVQINQSYVFEYFLNMIFALSSGFIIWYAGLWSAGDAKLFLGYAALVPLSVYSYGYISGFPSLTLLTNTFVPLLVFFGIKALLRKNIKTGLRKIKKTFPLKTIVFMPLSILGFSSVIGSISSFTGISLDIFSQMFLMVALYSILERVSKFLPGALGSVIVVLRITTGFSEIISYQFVYGLLGTTAWFVLLRYVVLELSYDAFTTPVAIKKLRPGMLLAEAIYNDGNSYRKSPVTFPNMFSVFRKEGNPILQGKLTNDDIKRMKELHSSGKIKDDSIRVHQMVPFAGFMFLGVLLTIIFQGNFLVAFLKLFG